MKEEIININNFLEKTLCQQNGFCDENLFIARGDHQPNIPEQGWKVHISADSLADYINLLMAVVPDLIEADFEFKVVCPGHMDRMRGTQRGKYITLYTPDVREIEKLSSLSEDAVLMLKSSTSVPVQGELHLGGRLYGRYGSYVDPHFIFNPNTGEKESDMRGRAYPSWVEPIASIF